MSKVAEGAAGGGKPKAKKKVVGSGVGVCNWLMRHIHIAERPGFSLIVTRNEQVVHFCRKIGSYIFVPLSATRIAGLPARHIRMGRGGRQVVPTGIDAPVMAGLLTKTEGSPLGTTLHLELTPPGWRRLGRRRLRRRGQHPLAHNCEEREGGAGGRGGGDLPSDGLPRRRQRRWGS